MPSVLLPCHSLFHRFLFLFNLTSYNIMSSQLISSGSTWANLISAYFMSPHLHRKHPALLSCALALCMHTPCFFISCQNTFSFIFFSRTCPSMFSHPNKTQQLFPWQEKFICKYTNMYTDVVGIIMDPSPLHPKSYARERLYFRMFPCTGRKTLFVLKKLKHAANCSKLRKAMQTQRAHCVDSGLERPSGWVEALHNYKEYIKKW